VLLLLLSLLLRFRAAVKELCEQLHAFFGGEDSTHCERAHVRIFRLHAHSGRSVLNLYLESDIYSARTVYIPVVR
jgi:hypothetical protein